MALEEAERAEEEQRIGWEVEGEKGEEVDDLVEVNEGPERLH